MPRDQAVWEGSVRAARIYEGYGDHGSTDEGRREDLTGLWNFVWHHGIADNFDAAVESLNQQGVYKVRTFVINGMSKAPITKSRVTFSNEEAG